MAMKRLKIAELKNQLSRYLRAVENGAEVEVTDRDRPIARIVPVGGPEPRIIVVPPKRSFAAFRRRRFAPARWPSRSTEILLEERQGR